MKENYAKYRHSHVLSFYKCYFTEPDEGNNNAVNGFLFTQDMEELDSIEPVLKQRYCVSW